MRPRLSIHALALAAVAASAAGAAAQPALGKPTDPAALPPRATDPAALTGGATDAATLDTEPSPALMLDWLGDGPRDRHWGRMLIEVGAFFGVMQAVYWSDYEFNKVDFTYEGDWENVRARLITLEAWHLDDNAYETNGWRHPVQGGLNYLFARSNGFSALESYAVSLTQSAVWELFGEYREDVSVNDIVLTPRAGSVLGETMWQLGLFFLRGERRWPYQVIGNIGTGGKGLLDWWDGKTSSAPRVGALGLPTDVVHRFETSMTAGRWVVGGDAKGFLRTSIDTELILIPGFARPGNARRLYASPAYSSLHVEATRADETLTDFRLAARVGITSWHRKRLHDGCGYNLLFGIGSAYEYGQHVGGPDRDTRSTRDQIAMGHVGGGNVDLTLHRGDLSLRAVADGYGNIAVVRNYAIDAHRAEHPDDYVRSTIERHNYHHAIGVTARATVVGSYKGLRLGVSFQQDWLRSIQGIDRHQDEIVDDYSLVDTRAEGRAWLSYERPLRPGLALGLGIGLEARRRSGSARDTYRSDTEHAQTVNAQLVF